jgi:predicted RNA-binding Zn-ribbon protein involved in translation (DUF1610 family)
MNRIFWDIETAPNIGTFWKAGYKIRIPHDNILQEKEIICICWKREGVKKVHHLEWDWKKLGNNQADKKMIKEFAKVVADADELVAHNGDRFDMAWVKARALIHGVDLFPFQKTVDTLAWSRKLYFNSHRLDYLGKHLLGEGKIDTSYGMWKEIMLNNSKKAMADMVKYCKKDVVLLEKVYHELLKFNKPKTHVGVLHGGERWSCPYCGSEDVLRNRKTVTAAGTIQHTMKCKSCGKYHTINNKVYNDYLEAKKSSK